MPGWQKKTKMRPLAKIAVRCQCLGRVNTACSVLLLCLACCIPTADTLQQVTTFPKQPLPDECVSHFNDIWSCPDVGVDSYTNLNQLCCNKVPNASLHCSSNGQNLTIACLPLQTIEKGYYPKIENKDGYPHLTIHPCNSSSSFEPNTRPSSQSYHPYCVHSKTNCSTSGRQLLCRGGTTKDDQCMCALSDSSKCTTSFTTADHECHCKNHPCPDGTAQKITYDYEAKNCPNDEPIHVPVNYTCVPIPNQKNDSELVTSANTTETESSMKYLGLFFLVVLLPTVAVILYKYNTTFRRQVDRLGDHVCQIRHANLDPPAEAHPMV